MRIESLTLKGLTAFRGEATVDCTTLPQGIVAIVGPNGHGKTTLLESLGPAPAFREFPSRADRSLVDYATGPDSFLDQVVTFDGRGTYRLRVNLDGVKRATEAVLEQIGNDGRALRLSDGKVKDYDRVVAGLFPSKELLLASSFAAQNRRGSFVTGSKAERKALFSEMLGLGHYEQMAETARTIANALDRRRIALRATLDRLEAETADAIIAGTQAEADRLQAELGHVEADQRVLVVEVDAAAAAVAQAQAALDAGQQSMRDRQELVARYQLQLAARERADVGIAALAPERDRRVADIDGRTEAARAQNDAHMATRRQELEQTQRTLDLELARIEEWLQAQQADRRKRITNNEALRANAAAILADVHAVADRERVVAEIRAHIAGQRAELAGLEREADARRTQIFGRSTVERDLAAARTQAALLGEIPCGGVGPYDSCKLLTSAVQARATIPILGQQVDRLRQDRAALGTIEDSITVRRQWIEQRERDLQTAEQAGPVAADVAARKAKLDQVDARIAELTAELAQLVEDAEQRQAQARAAANERHVAIGVAMSDLQVSYSAITRQHAEALDALTAELRARHAALEAERATAVTALDATAAALAALPPAIDLAALESALGHADATRSVLQLRTVQLASVHARVTTEIRQQDATITRLQDAIAERDLLRAAIAQLDTDLVDWQTLALACGPHGLPVLEMDAAGPTVSELTNDLLEHALGSRRFTVELITQEARTGHGKGGLKETFDLAIYDSERGSAQRAISDLSGGEQVLIDEALKGAIALFMNARNERPIRTCWRDETTGALDPANALRYMAMLRRIQERGGFERLFVISHNADAAALADAQLYVHDGQIDVRLAPFTQEAA